MRFSRFGGMLRQYVKFALNGGMLGVVAMLLQAALFSVLGAGGALDYAAASALAYVPLVFVNFMVQRTWVFNRPGMLIRFVFVNLAIMILVSVLSPLCKEALDFFFAPPWGQQGGFIAASIIGSVPSFLAKRRFVFGIPGNLKSSSLE